MSSVSNTAVKAPTADQYVNDKKAGFECSMDGYTNQVKKLTELFLFGLSMNKEIIEMLLPMNARLAVMYAY